MSDMQIKIVAYLYVIGMFVDLVWEILKIIDDKDDLMKNAHESLALLPITEKTTNVIIIIVFSIVVALYCGAWPITMHLDIWKKKKAKAE